MKLLEDINSKLDKLLTAEPVKATPANYTPKPSVAPSPAVSTVKPSAVVDKQEMEEKMKEKPPIEGRRVCSECGGTAFNTVEDKTQVLHQMGGVKIYAKCNIL
ncbi:MAG: hypothetical protein JSV23_05530 [Promethearchaeota archaeon]|nr:MAG: hypothetical protein JSV23_05530 [Candidatus Lokiarchaeota archaeon]